VSAVPFWNRGKWSAREGLRLRGNWSDSQLGWPKAAPTVGLSKIRCFNDQVIFQITCVYLYYRKRRDESNKKLDPAGDGFPNRESSARTVGDGETTGCGFANCAAQVSVHRTDANLGYRAGRKSSGAPAPHSPELIARPAFSRALRRDFIDYGQRGSVQVSSCVQDQAALGREPVIPVELVQHRVCPFAASVGSHLIHHPAAQAAVA